MTQTRALGRATAIVASASALAALLAVATPEPASADVSCQGTPATHVGTGGDDVITGTAGNDVIVGLGGNDTISGLDGNDTICAGAGDDTVYGESAVLLLVAVSGDDTIYGEAGTDVLVGDFGTITSPTGGGAAGWNDTLDGGTGSDVIAGDALDVTISLSAIGAAGFSDTIHGGEGDDADTIYGDTRNFTVNVVGGVGLEIAQNVVDGGGGADTIYGNYERVTSPGLLFGTGWRDSLQGGSGSDTIYGDVRFGQNRLVPAAALAFADEIDGGSGSDTADGGPGTDTCTDVEAPTNCEQ